MLPFLSNPVYDGLCSGDQRLGLGTDKVKFFDVQVSPFAGFEEGYEKGFADLHQLVPLDRVILYATPLDITEPGGWRLLHKIKGIQMVCEADHRVSFPNLDPVPLQEEHVKQMMELTALTKPGPFGPRTIDFGNYFGIFESGKLAAMTGQRLHPHHFTEVSAVCTHPDCLGKGYASALVQFQVALIQRQDRTAFLHVREDNHRAIHMYQRLGFVLSGPMIFYVMKRLEPISKTHTKGR